MKRISFKKKLQYIVINDYLFSFITVDKIIEELNKLLDSVDKKSYSDLETTRQIRKLINEE